MELSTEVLMDIHRRMLRIRLFEEAAGQLAEAAKLPGSSTSTWVRKRSHPASAPA